MLLPARNQDMALIPFMARREGVHQEVGHRSGTFYLRTNLRSPNFDILVVPTEPTASKPIDLASATILRSGSNEEFIERMEIFQDYMLAWVWTRGIRKILIYTFKEQSWRTIEYGGEQASYSVLPATTTDMYNRYVHDYYSQSFLYTNASYLTPYTTYEYNVPESTTRIVTQPFPVSNDSKDFIEKRFLFDSYDGKKIPVVLVYDKKLDPDGDGRIQESPIFMQAYGAYGTFIEPYPTSNFLPLLRRGVVLAFVHPRGDGDMGASWYFEGKLEVKLNTFLDVWSSMRELVRRGVTKEGRIALMARSAGGLVSGTVANWFGSVYLEGGKLMMMRLGLKMMVVCR
jgi:oligopeptidase B